MFLLSSGYADIEYFSTPLHLDQSAPDTGLQLFVSDPSSTPPLEEISHHVVISQPTADGTRPALEIVVLGNPASVTRVAGDSAHPVWSVVLPRGALGAAMGQGDVSPLALFHNVTEIGRQSGALPLGEIVRFARTQFMNYVAGL